MSRLELVLCGLALIGCSGEGTMIAMSAPDSGADTGAATPTASAMGAALQKPIRLSSSYAYYEGLQKAYLPGVQQPPDGFKGVRLLLNTASETCASRLPATKNATNIEVDLLSRDRPSTPVVLGEYKIQDEGPSGNAQGCVFMCNGLGLGQAIVLLSVTNDQCVPASPGAPNWAKGGTITITASDANHIAGSFHVLFTDGDVTGTFDAPVCTGAETTTFAPSCQ